MGVRPKRSFPLVVDTFADSVIAAASLRQRDENIASYFVRQFNYGPAENHFILT